MTECPKCGLERVDEMRYARIIVHNILTRKVKHGGKCFLVTVRTVHRETKRTLKKTKRRVKSNRLTKEIISQLEDMGAVHWGNLWGYSTYSRYTDPLNQIYQIERSG